ncbi:hypothetical protein SAY86_018027 [Trapa natans]|uniref:Uncharacterized protein n=1 Tax=Trapa natans TaxID=22666 RepID=A0AAN7LLF7_TRANT|nr:hypothetical protein SAY86_018027 [Trapa natans]
MEKWAIKNALEQEWKENLPSTPDPKQGYSSLRGSASANSFEPQFDGLRFIQTLVTGHCSQMILERSNSKCPVFCRCGYLSLLSSSSQWKKN